MRVAPIPTRYAAQDDGLAAPPQVQHLEQLRRTATEWTADVDDGRRQVELRKLFYYRRVVRGMWSFAAV